MAGVPVSPLAGWYPGIALSLRELMERFNAEYLFRLSRYLIDFMNRYARIGDQVLIPEMRDVLSDGLDALRDRLEQYNLRFTIALVDRFKRTLKNGTTLTGMETARLFADIQHRVEDELDGTIVLRIPPKRAPYYEKADAFGADVMARFPTTTYDLEEACNCFALARYNAVIYHVMRVLEAGLEDFAAALNVPLPADKSWDRLVRECRREVRNMPKGPDKERYDDVLNHLDGVRNAWRNPTMHPRAGPYTEQQALDIFNNAKALMQSLACLL